MAGIGVDPVISVVRYAYRMALEHRLTDYEAAIHSAAFVLFGPDSYRALALEASFYSSQMEHRYIDTVAEVARRRTVAGVLGTMETTVVEALDIMAPMAAQGPFDVPAQDHPNQDEHSGGNG